MLVKQQTTQYIQKHSCLDFQLFAAKQAAKYTATDKVHAASYKQPALIKDMVFNTHDYTNQQTQFHQSKAFNLYVLRSVLNDLVTSVIF